jgi:CheY-like chemotaxis protein
MNKDPHAPPFHGSLPPEGVEPPGGGPAAARTLKRPGPLPPILLVEDNPMDLDLTLRAFSKRQFANQIQVARDGEEAMAWLPRWEAGEPMPAVMLLDINLPRMTGLEVLQAFKRHELARRIPVVVLTSSRDDRDLGKAYDLGVNSYIEKPVSFNKFIEVAGHIELYWCVFNERPYRP